LLLEALEEGPRIVPELAEYVGVPKTRIWRHILAMTMKNIIEVVGERDHYMEYQRRGQ
jgi:DNA-binding IclR family transcriptional regulator